MIGFKAKMMIVLVLSVVFNVIAIFFALDMESGSVLPTVHVDTALLSTMVKAMQEIKLYRPEAHTFREFGYPVTNVSIGAIKELHIGDRVVLWREGCINSKYRYIIIAGWKIGAENNYIRVLPIEPSERDNVRKLIDTDIKNVNLFNFWY
jgi:hypothetical protein